MDAHGRTQDPSAGSDAARAGARSANAATHGGLDTPGNVTAGAQWYVPKEDMAFAHKMYEVNDGDRVIAPNTVYTNGTWTFFHYGKRSATVDRPVVYRVVNGVETLVNTRWIGRNNEVLVAEATGDFVLRNGRRTVCVQRHQHRQPTVGDGHDAAESAEQATDSDAPANRFLNRPNDR
jgi:hypothetical protein